MAKVLVLGFLLMPAVAYAGFFDDGRWYMASDQWMPYEENASGTSLTDGSDRLNWQSDGWGDGHEAFRCYGSNWQFDLSEDFEFQVGYHHGHVGTFEGDDADIQVGLISFYPELGQTEPVYAFSLDASNNFRADSSYSKNLYTFYEYGPGGFEELDADRFADDGIFYAVYNAESDTLQLQAIEGGAVVAGEDFGGLKSSFGLDELRVFLGGSTTGAALGSGDAYLQNFQMNVGSGVVPEPVSTSLFLLGAGVIGLRRRRKTSK
ncbi:MAG: PEP-CTERM sorting domain-containing protein [Candidatus Omnitrophota bacterium]